MVGVYRQCSKVTLLSIFANRVSLRTTFTGHLVSEECPGETRNDTETQENCLPGGKCTWWTFKEKIKRRMNLESSSS